MTRSRDAAPPHCTELSEVVWASNKDCSWTPSRCAEAPEPKRARWPGEVGGLSISACVIFRVLLTIDWLWGLCKSLHPVVIYIFTFMAEQPVCLGPHCKHTSCSAVTDPASKPFSEWCFVCFRTFKIHFYICVALFIWSVKLHCWGMNMYSSNCEDFLFDWRVRLQFRHSEVVASSGSSLQC